MAFVDDSTYVEPTSEAVDEAATADVLPLTYAGADPPTRPAPHQDAAAPTAATTATANPGASAGPSSSPVPTPVPTAVVASPGRSDPAGLLAASAGLLIAAPPTRPNGGPLNLMANVDLGAFAGSLSPPARVAVTPPAARDSGGRDTGHRHGQVVLPPRESPAAAAHRTSAAPVGQPPLPTVSEMGINDEGGEGGTITADMEHILWMKFAVNPTPSVAEAAQLSARLGVPVDDVVAWFRARAERPMTTAENDMLSRSIAALGMGSRFDGGGSASPVDEPLNVGLLIHDNYMDDAAPSPRASTLAQGLVLPGAGDASHLQPQGESHATVGGDSAAGASNTTHAADPRDARLVGYSKYEAPDVLETMERKDTETPTTGWLRSLAHLRRREVPDETVELEDLQASISQLRHGSHGHSTIRDDRLPVASASDDDSEASSGGSPPGGSTSMARSMLRSVVLLAENEDDDGSGDDHAEGDSKVFGIADTGDGEDTPVELVTAQEMRLELSRQFPGPGAARPSAGGGAASAGRSSDGAAVGTTRVYPVHARAVQQHQERMLRPIDTAAGPRRSSPARSGGWACGLSF